ncbi:hypothetical protein FA95DRAFT_1567625 [Auriscalpium vulgare]|uniref:Uncharacterized protein n=1 Tax=Auriscalpium vulgare TaxID=40419 RepID=A0ACB8R3K4_9AGAM|nr:hypothetical protein FA95DRAFT_1567625 [Auriscalpium vulgare]
MDYTPSYFRRIVERCGVAVFGWPTHVVPFCNLSRATSSVPKLRTLLAYWESGHADFYRLTPAELAHLSACYEAALQRGEITEPSARKRRNDVCRKRTQVDRTGPIGTWVKILLPVQSAEFVIESPGELADDPIESADDLEVEKAAAAEVDDVEEFDDSRP